MLAKLSQILIFFFTLLVLGCGESDPDSNQDNSSDIVEYVDNVWQEDCEEYNDCESAEVEETEGYYSLKISDGYFGGHVEGTVDMTSVGDEKDGIKSSGYLIFLNNDDEEQSSIETINISLLNIGDDSGRMATGEYTFVKDEPADSNKQYGVIKLFANDADKQANTSFVSGKVTIHQVEDLVYAINDSVDLVHDVATASLEVIMHDKIKAKNFSMGGDMRIVTIGKMRRN